MITIVDIIPKKRPQKPYRRASKGEFEQIGKEPTKRFSGTWEPSHEA